jgi:hypothetical protein
MKTDPMLSKSRFLAGLQCQLRLWYQCYNRELAAEVSLRQQAVFDVGNEVGRMATQLYPNGVLINEAFYQHRQAVQSTVKAIHDPKIRAVFEAAFIYDDIRIQVDILERAGNNSWNLVEVKSSTSAKEIHLPDVAIQFYVLKSYGLNINQAGILHLNNQYIYDGENLNLEALFAFEDLTDPVISLQQEISTIIAEQKTMLANSDAPEIQPSRHCSKPYDCEFWNHCTRDMPEFWVFNLSVIGQSKLDKLAQMGIQDISDIPSNFPLSEIQDRIRISVTNQQEYVSDDLITELKDVIYPVHFLDFETISPAIPRYADTRPYQTIPFQWSDHILFEDGNLDHLDYLCNEDKDPREEFTLTLLNALGIEGTIVIYTSYETGLLNSLIEYLPHYSDELHAIIDRFKDLYAIVKKHYYHPKFYGSFSLKCVLPALVPTMGYDKLFIQDGAQASIEYLRLIDSSTPEAEQARIRSDLLTYCGHDTLAMVKIREKLLSKS